MKVYLTTLPGLLAEGDLKGVISEGDTFYPHIVIEMNVVGSGPVEVTLDEKDLSTIIRLARNSSVQGIREAIR